MAKRVNTRFLIVLTAVFACLIAAAVVAKVTVFRKDPAVAERAGDEAVKEGQYKKAIENYRFAIAASKNANGLLLKTGDAFNMMVADDPQNLYSARAAWSQALANDPNYEPALQKLLDSYWEQAEIMPLEVDLYNRVRETAQRLAELRPGDVKALAKAHIATIRPWLEGTPVKVADVDASTKALGDLISRDPSDADIRFYYAQAKLKYARERREREREKSDKAIAEAAAAFNSAVQDPPKDPSANALMQLRAFQVFTRLDQLEKADAAEAERRRATNVIAIDPGTGGDAPQAAKGSGGYEAKAQKALAAAVESAKQIPPDSDTYFDVQVQAADQAMRQKRVDDAEKICKDLIDKRPDDQKARLVFARLLSSIPSKRDDAIKVLSREIKVSRMIGPRGYEAQQRKIETLIELVNIKLDRVRGTSAAGQSQEAATSTAKQREDMLTDVRNDLDRLEPMIPGESVAVLRLKARLQQLEGRTADSIQTYQRAVTLMEGSPQERKDYDLINELAVAYLQAGQTGSAKKLLDQIIARYEWYVPARLQMAQLLMNENKLDDARLHLREAERQLAKLPGDSPEYPRYRAEFDRTGLAMMKLEKNPKLEESFAKIPETTHAEKLQKVAVARQIGKTDDAIRLARAAVQEDAKDLAALEALLSSLLTVDRRQEALDALDAGIKANPDKAERLKPAREQLAAAVQLINATPEDVYKTRKELLVSQPESPANTLKLADLEREFNHPERAEELLVKLHQQNPNDVPVISRLFDLHVSLGNWDKAKGYLDKLVAKNADEAGGLLFQYRFAMSQKNTTEALRLAKALVNAYPNFDVSFVAYGQALQADRRYAEAVQQFQAARQRKPQNLDALRGLIECYIAQSQFESEREVLTEARALFPSDPLFRDLQLQYQIDHGDPMQAVAACEQLQRERPKDPERWFKLGLAYRAAAKMTPDPQRSELQGKARTLLQQAATTWPADARFVLQQSELALETGDPAGGEKIVLAHVTRPENKDRFEPLTMLAEYYVKANKLDEAEAAYDGAIKKADALASGKAEPAKTGAAAAAIRSAPVDIRLMLSGLLTQRRKFDEALKVLDDADRIAAAAAPTPAQGSAPTGVAAALGDRKLLNQRLSVLIIAGRRADAEKVLLDTMAKVPGAADDLGLQMMLVRVNYDGGRYDEALGRVNKLLKADPDNLEARFYRGQILMRKPQPDLAEAIAELSVVRKADPRHAATRILLADAFRLQGDANKSVRELEEGVKSAPMSREMRLRLMDFRSAEGTQDYNEVLRLVREARAMPELKDDPVWAWREARVWAERKDWPKAITAIEDAAKLAPTDVAIVREYHSILLQAGDYRRVLDQTDRLVRENRAPWWAFMNRGAAKNGLKDTPGAMAEFNLALTAAGSDNAAVEQIVKTMTNTVGKDKALEQVMARADQDVRWKLLAAALHSIYKEWDKAVTMLDDVQAHFDELQPRQQVQALKITGPLYQLAQPPQLDKAKAAYEKLLKLDPNDLFALNNLATLLVDDSLVPQPQKAKEHSKKAYEQVKRAQPFPAAIWDTHGWVLVQCGGSDLEEGIDILQRVVRQTSLPEAHYHLGEAFLKKQDAKKAIEELKEAADSINQAPERGIAVSPDLDKKIRSATERAKDLLRTQGGGAAVAQ